ncbi:nucleoside deaminase [Vagococcus sp. BWB3-3]|uniref:Nucleoside deaminase n=1 Tax=Vagococcus allomyrinae TaxID=2794353 RepID=A0A940P956_9ENTE|nr:nucleoside deaminase [Vagococcus allomyrinae]MBP1044029.1 nucleoside deaminase [Vagococcus allomyrinae]
MTSHETYLTRCIELSQQARDHGNTPFGALLVNQHGEIILEQENIEITEKVCTGHAETTLVQRASHLYSKEELASCLLYTTAEPCAMCTGAIYWSNVGTIVYGMTEKRLLALTGDDDQNPTFDLPCREVLARGQKEVTVIGPFPELELAIAAVHQGYWG